MRAVSERRLVDVLISHLRKHGQRVAREVSHYERRIDVLVVTAESDELHAIEAKTRDWPRALAQATVNLAAADRSYVAIQADFAHRVPLEEIRARGLGLIAVGSRWGDVVVIERAPRSPYVNRVAVERLREGFGEA